MDFPIAIFAALVGYLMGSISFARLVTRFASPDKKFRKIEMDIPGSQEKFTSEAVSATGVRFQLGTRYGCLTSILDMLKVALPTLAFRFVYPQSEYFLIVAALGVIGHIWPIYYRFKGGRGQSPIMGGMLVIDWLGLIVTNLGGFLIGRFIIRNYSVFIGAYLILLIPWMWFRFQDAGYLMYALVINLAYWTAWLPEYREIKRLNETGHAVTLTEIAVAMDEERSDERINRVMRWLGLRRET